MEARAECAARVRSACVSAICFLLSDLEPSQRPELLLAEDFPGILQLTADSPSPVCSLPSPSASHLALTSTARWAVTMFFCSLPASGEGRTPSSPPLTHTSRGWPFLWPETNFYCKLGTQKGQIWLLS